MTTYDPNHLNQLLFLSDRSPILTFQWVKLQSTSLLQGKYLPTDDKHLKEHVVMVA